MGKEGGSVGGANATQDCFRIVGGGFKCRWRPSMGKRKGRFLDTGELPLIRKV